VLPPQAETLGGIPVMQKRAMSLAVEKAARASSYSSLG
jgi:hypothetical protein